jgi:hypothetical protein
MAMGEILIRVMAMALIHLSRSRTVHDVALKFWTVGICWSEDKERKYSISIATWLNHPLRVVCWNLKDYPDTFSEFRDRFAAEEACITYLISTPMARMIQEPWMQWPPESISLQNAVPQSPSVESPELLACWEPE